MRVKKASAQALQEWVGGLIEKRKVIGVQARDERFGFAPLSKAGDLRLDYDVSVLPPKAFLLPPRENLVTFTRDGACASCRDEGPMVLLGVHPYDVAAIGQMDKIFSDEKYDVHYMARRDATIVVAVDVQNVSANTFAGYMGTAHVEEGFDVLLTKVDGDYVVDARTSKGESIMGKLSSAPDADSKALDQRKEVWAENDRRLRRHELKAAREDWPDLLAKGCEHPVWKEKAELCFSCGSCVLTCPTCYCFDVRDDVDWTLQSGVRSRVWDGCMLTDFAKVSGNHNFRKDKAERYRHRYYRKGKYVPEKTGGQIACVGCGRCITACVSGIANPVEVFNRLMEAK